jgi:hypothetical protein
MAFCGNCGQQIPDDAPACPYCSQQREPNRQFQPQEKGFFASLFDVSMQEMITPKIVRIIYILGLIGIGIGTLIAFISYLTAASYSGSVFPVLAAVIIVPLCALLAVIYLRVVLELIVLAFNIYDELKEIRRGHTANSCRK